MSDDYRARIALALFDAGVRSPGNRDDAARCEELADAVLAVRDEKMGADRIVLEEQVRKQAEMLGQARHDLAISLGIELTLPQAVEAVIDRCGGMERKLHEARERGNSLIDDLEREQTARANAQGDAREAIRQRDEARNQAAQTNGKLGAALGELHEARAEVADLRAQLATARQRTPECQTDLIDLVSEPEGYDDEPITPCGDPACQCAIIAPFPEDQS